LVASPFGLDKEIKKIRLGVFDFLILRTSGFPNGAGIPFPTRLRIPSKRRANRGRFLWHWCVKLTFARALLRFLLLARKHEVCVGSTNETKNSRSGSFLVPRAEGRHEKEGMNRGCALPIENKKCFCFHFRYLAWIA
jgi:hypothetical protein